MITIQYNKIIKIIKRDGVLYSIERIFNKIRGGNEEIFKNITGIIHVGANLGQEIELYEQYSLDVIWIEPIPEIFEKLQENINGHPKQKALKYLLTDADDQEISLNIANNDGASSSILELALHADIWPEINYIKSIPCRTITLNTLIKRENININLYQALALDTQGSELLVLKGGKDLLNNFQFILTEAADFESYISCCYINEITDFLENIGFKEIKRTKFAHRIKGGNYYNVIYQRKT